MRGMGEEVKVIKILPECVEYANYLTKEFGLTPDDVHKVAEVCSNSGIKRWRGAIAFAAAYIMKFGPRASGAAAIAKESYGYLWTFAPPGMTPSMFKTQVSECVKEILKRYPELSLVVETGEHVIELCSKLPVPEHVCRDAAEIFEKIKGLASMTGKSKRGIAAGAVAYAAERAGVRIDLTLVSRVFRVTRPTVTARVADIEEILRRR